MGTQGKLVGLLAFAAFIMLSSIVTSSYAQSTIKKQLFPTDDAYVVADLNDPSDRAGLAKLNTGNLEFLKSWYAWNVTQAGTERILSIVYLKFDLSEIEKDDVNSANLQLYPFIANLTAPSRSVDVYATFDVPWNETGIVYIGAPALDTKLNSTVTVTEESTNKYLTWDVTHIAKEKAGSNMTLALVMKNINRNNEEQVVFRSMEHSTVLERPTLIMQVAAPEVVTPPTPVGAEPNYAIVAAVAAAAAGGGFGAGIAVGRMKKNKG